MTGSKPTATARSGQRPQVLADFAEQLRHLRLAAGQPPLSRLERMSPWLKTSTTSEALRGIGCPSLDFVLAFVAACGRYAEQKDQPLASNILNRPWRHEWAKVQRALQEARRAAQGEPVAIDVEEADIEEKGQPPGQTPSTWPVPRQVPPAAFPFVGRQRQQATLDALLTQAMRDGVRAGLCVVDGPAGAGKTELAVQWAHRVEEQFPDGVLFIDLHGFGPGEPATPLEVLGRLLRALDAPATIPHDEAELAGVYRSMLANRRLLLILDNAVNAQQVRPLLPGTGRCFTIVTSRSNLAGLVARSGADRITVDALTVDDAADLLYRMIGAQRADDPAALAELAALCAQLPLALRIAAEQMASHPKAALSDMCAQLRDANRLEVLATDDGDETAAVRLALSWSYQALPADAARMFRLLGIHTGPHIGLDAAAALVGRPPANAQQMLDRLTATHLIQRTVDGRYRLHDLLQYYAAELAATDQPDRAGAVGRLLDWYLTAADAADRALLPQRRRPALSPSPTRTQLGQTYEMAVRWFDIELANVVAAINQALREGYHTVAAQLPTIMLGFFNLRKPWSEWITTFQVGLTAARHGGDRLFEAHLLNGLGIAYRELRQLDQALEHHQQAAAIYHHLGERRGEGMALGNLGTVHSQLGDLDECEEHYLRARSIMIEISDRWGEGIQLHNLAEHYQERGRHAEAHDCAHRALRLCIELDDRIGAAAALDTIGKVHWEDGKSLEAIDCFQQALLQRRQAGDQQGVAITLHRLGRALSTLEQVTAATNALYQALTIFDELGDPQAEDVRANIRNLDSTAGSMAT